MNTIAQEQVLLIRRLLSRIRPTDLLDEDNCWNWVSGKSHEYGVLLVDGKNEFAHRLSYRLFVAELVKNKEIDHLCQNKSCVNPRHLELVNHSENILRYHRNRAHCKRGHIWTEDNIIWTKRIPKTI